MRLRLLLAATALAFAAPLAAAPADDFRALLDEHYRWLLRNSPTYATALGVRDYDDRIHDLCREARERQVGEARAFLARVDAIPADQLGASRPGHPGDPAARRWPRRSRRTASASATCCSPPMTAGTRASPAWRRNLPFRTRADYESYLTRIAQYPRLNDQALAITANAVRGGYVLPCSVLGGHERTHLRRDRRGSGPVALLRAVHRQPAGRHQRGRLDGDAGAGAADHHRR